MKMKDIKTIKKVVNDTILSDNQIGELQKKILDGIPLSAIIVQSVDAYKENLLNHLEEKIDESIVKI